MIKDTLRKIKNSPAQFKSHIHQKWPHLFGFEVRGELIQFYRNDSQFQTFFSFHHFIESFTKFAKLQITVTVEAFDRQGQSLGKGRLILRDRGVQQVPLSQLVPHLDEYGVFTVSMDLQPRYVPEIDYVGALSPQFMTLLIPTQGSRNAPQMIHSHKFKQGRWVMKREHVRHSSHIEDLADLKSAQLYFLNSSGAALRAGTQIFNAQSGQLLQEDHLQIPAYGTCCLELPVAELKTRAPSIHFRYRYDHSVDHKKPILFRENHDGVWSCNHT